MFKRTAGISDEARRELVEKLEEFGWNVSNGGIGLSVDLRITVSRHVEEKGVSIEIPIGTILEVTYHPAGFGRGGDVVESVELGLGTRSVVTFSRDGSLGVKI